MRLHRFICEYKQTGTMIVVTDQKVVHQVVRVFRMELDDRIIICDNDYRDHVCRITEATKVKLVLEEESIEMCAPEDRKITIALSLIKKDLFEFALQKMVEVGVTDIVPIISNRTVVKKLRTERLEDIVREATEQSGRGKTPILHATQSLEEFLIQGKPGICAVADFEGASVDKIFKDHDHARTVIIGPEGGWDDSERALFHQHQLPSISLGNSVLRAETAAVVAGWCAKNN